MKTKIGVFACCMAALVGCGPSVEEKRVPYSQLGEEAVLASVNGEKYTKGDFERDFGIRTGLLGLSLVSRSGDEVEGIRREFRRQALGQFVTRELLLAEARRRGLVLTGDEMRAYQEQFARGLSQKVPMSFENIEKAIPGSVTDFRRSLAKDALAQRMSGLLRKECIAVPVPSVEEAKQAVREAAAYNMAFAQTNAAMFARATNAWKSVRAGTDFAAAGRALHESNKFITYIPACDTGLAEAKALSKGAVTLPIRQDQGIVIFKANDDAEATNRYSCIFFALSPEYMIEPVEETRRTLHRAAVDEAYAAKVEALRRAAAIHYPYGKNPFHE